MIVMLTATATEIHSNRKQKKAIAKKANRVLDAAELVSFRVMMKNTISINRSPSQVLSDVRKMP